MQAKIQTALPVVVVSYDAVKQKVSLQPTVKGFIKQEDGSQKAVDYPVLQDVPVKFASGGGMTFTHPISPGDEGTVIFSSRAPDSFQQSGGVQVPADASMHGLSGGRFIPGGKSDPKVISSVSTTAAELRSDDGKTKISLSGAGGVGISTDKAVGIAAANGVSITGGPGNVSFTGTLIVSGEIELNGIKLSTHKHTGVQPGSGNSTGPTN
ncbi:Gp138 family membrane-puncturing spike protein [Bosea sp. 2KB_26]|uniref:Gp138 family membrane-puncturing spike protein n=1 Tax=Bosea sp. 2KB_26 TaxID=3237475 RepID=UPI003F927678